MNADGSPDLLWRNVVTGANVVWYMNGVSILSQGTLPTVSDLGWTLAAALDVNSDGVAELFWRHRGTGTNVVWSMSGVNVVSQVSLPSVPDTSWRIAGPTAAQIPSDVNGDQHPDLVWRNTSTGANVVWHLNGTTLVSQAPPAECAGPDVATRGNGGSERRRASGSDLAQQRDGRECGVAAEWHHGARPSEFAKRARSVVAIGDGSRHQRGREARRDLAQHDHGRERGVVSERDDRGDAGGACRRWATPRGVSPQRQT